MNMHPDDRFDATLREHYREATARLPGPLRLQLDPRIVAQRAAVPDTPQRPRWALPAGLAGAALVAALVLSPALRAPGDAVDATRIAADAGPAAAADDALLESSPDFYAWLGSDEVRVLAME
ncbi:hypothetical protein [Luteimonas sp. e5]